jgi:predicted metalloendopeptidase
MNKTRKHKQNKTKKEKEKEKFNFRSKSGKHKTFKFKTIKMNQSEIITRLGLSDKNNCSVNLQPFEKDYESHLTDRQLVMSNEQVKTTFIKQLLSPFSPHSIKPTSNFYNYINYMWLKNTKTNKDQKYITQIDNFRLVQDKVYRELDDIVVDYVKNNNNRLSKNLSNYYKTITTWTPTDAGRKYAKDYTNFVDELRKDKKNLWKLLAYVNHHEMVGTFAPFYWSIKPDEKNSGIFECYLEPHSFNILDFTVYIDDGTNVKYKEKYRQELKKYYRRTFNFILGPNNNIDVSSIYDVEIKIFNALFCNSENVDAGELNGYNRIHKDEALSKYGFNWIEFCKEFGFANTHIPDFFICKNLKYLKCCTELLLNEWNSEEWRPYWLQILYRKIVRLTKSSRQIYYDYQGKFQRGETGAFYKSSKVGSTIFLSYPFNSFLRTEYVRKYYDAKKVDFVKVLAEELRLVFIRIIKRNKWLSDKTRNYAIKKLQSINFILAQSPNIVADPDLDYCSNDLYKNMNIISEWRHKLFMSLVGKPVIDFPIMDWGHYPAKLIGNQAYVVNASYNPLSNNIYIPLGYIQEPFVDLNERGIEYNLANVGFTLAHELSHCLDESGSKYNIAGNLDDWWTESDTKKYQQIQKDIVNQYEVFAKKDGIEFDASLSVGEDIADISGLAICEEYLRDYQEKNQMLTPSRAQSFHQFYTYYCIQMRQIIAKKALRAQLNTNPHPLDVYRCNVPLTRSQTFRALYNVKEGQGMWWHNTNTVW